ncbi:MAG: hypothetical protein WCL28_04115 [bacterium]
MIRIRTYSKFRILILMFLSSSSVISLAAESSATAKPSKSAPHYTGESESLVAYKRFWDAFRDYEIKSRRASVEEYQKTMEGLESLYEKDEKDSLDKKINLLTGAIKRYRDNLEQISANESRPFVLINLAQTYIELSAIQVSFGQASEANENRKNALKTLEEIEKNYPDFNHLSQSLYLRASILEAANDNQAALPIWKKLSQKNMDQFGLHANLVMGDKEFENAAPEGAIRYYKRANEILQTLAGKERSLDELRVNYRLAWANFKAGKFQPSLNAITRVINPEIISNTVRHRQKILTDLGDLTAYCLFAQDNLQKTEEVLSARAYRLVGPQAALTLMQQYLTSNSANKAADVGKIASDAFSSAKELPDILKIRAKADDLAGRKASRLEALEQISMLLPAGSLWRQKNNDDSSVISHMEDIARSANELVASEYYQQGLDTGNPRKFMLAANYYTNLLVDAPTSEKAPQWRLQIANSKYFSGNLREAERAYSELIAGLKTPEEILLTAYYQRVLTMEKLWRTEYESAVQKGQDIAKNQRILSHLSNLENAVEEHATRFPAQSRSIDLLIVAASANRDQDRFTQAGRFWQRVLISNPSPGQRSIAVRGLIFNKIRAGEPAEIIETATNFLKFEQADSMLGGLRQELLGVLATAVNDESTRLGKRGQSDDAGTILLQAVSDFDDLPNREKFWRDGAYFLAISGNWARAQASAENFLTGNFREFSGDMKYLLARAHEYQLRFSQSVKSYIDLAEANPTHPRAVTSLERAEKLALADNNFLMAGRAAQDLARHIKVTPGRLAKLDAAIDHYMQGSAFAKARQTAEERLKNSPSLVEKLKSELAIGKIRYESGDIQVAIDDLDTLSKQIDRAKPELGESYRRLASETNMILGEHALKLFQNTKLNGLKTNAAAQVDRKSRIFTDLTDRFDKVAGLEVAEFSPKARFLVAQSATIFADEISSIPGRNGEPATLRNQTRFNQNVNHLRDLAQKYHGNNILAKQRAPQSFIRNEWIGKSAIALSNMSSSERATRSVNIDQLSTASSSDMPQQWSH